MTYKDSNNDSDGLAYDLRQRFALQIGDIRERIIIARNNRNYPEWYSALDSLFIEISHKLVDKEKKEFNELIQELNNLIRINRFAYEKKGGNSSAIYSKLRGMNMWLQTKMEEKDIFGSKYVDDGL